MHTETSKVENSVKGLSSKLKFGHGPGFVLLAQVCAWRVIFSGREPKSCLGRVFNFKLGSFAQ